MPEKTCKTCETTKDESLFLKNQYLCYDCNNVRRKQKRTEKLQQQTDNPKTCTECNKVKTEKDFAPDNQKCKKCTKKIYVTNAKNKKEELKKKGINTKTCIKCNEESSIDNYRPGENVCKSCQVKMTDEWRKEHPEEFKGMCKKYREKEDKREQINKYKRNEYKNNSIEKKTRDMRNKLRKYIKKEYPEDRVEIHKKIFGASPDKFRDWIEYCFKDGMTWDNYGEIWNFDHIKPCSSFDLENEDELKKCFNWKNTVPIICEDNYKKYINQDDTMETYYKNKADGFKNDRKNGILEYEKKEKEKIIKMREQKQKEKEMIKKSCRGKHEIKYIKDGKEIYEKDLNLNK
jgi:hypothetical protein